jgi:3-deoxy-D-manno-octulosonic-acid transferase
VLMGPSYENFRDVVEGMRDGDAIRIVSPEMLAETLIAMLRDTDDARALGERGRAVFEAQAGATARTVQALMALLQKSSVAGL